MIGWVFWIFLCGWQAGDRSNSSFTKGMPLSLKSAGVALLMVEPNSAPSSPTSWDRDLCRVTPKVQPRQKLTKPWLRRCCKPQPAMTYLPSLLLSFLHFWGSHSKGTAGMAELLEDDALCSSVPVLFGICNRNVLFEVFFFFFGNTYHCSSEKSMCLSTSVRKGVSLILFVQSLL